MTTSDSLFHEPATDPEPIVTPDPGTPNEGNGLPTAITAEQVQEMIAPLQQNLSRVQEELAVSEAARERLAGQLQSVQNQPVPTPAGPKEDFLDAFTDNPEKSVRDLADASTMNAMKQLAPLLEQQNDTIHQTIVASHKAQVDAEYGHGAWDTHFDTVFRGRVAELRESNARALSDPNIMQTEILGIHGLKRDALAALKGENSTAAEAAEAEKLQTLINQLGTTGLTGGQAVAPVPTSKEPTDEEKQYLASRAMAGMEPVSVTDLRASQARTQGTLAEYQAAKAGGTK
jgi:hypothetical protein